jgi:hypothetical protein
MVVKPIQKPDIEISSCLVRSSVLRMLCMCWQCLGHYSIFSSFAKERSFLCCSVGKTTGNSSTCTYSNLVLLLSVLYSTGSVFNLL